MTLILSASTGMCAFQVSDRLVSQRTGTGWSSFDPESNKSVFFVASDGMLSISYSGVAYLDTTPTDRWIAEKLRGESLPPIGSYSMGFPAPVDYTVVQAVEHLRSELETLWIRIGRLARKQVVILSIVGWRGNGDHDEWIPILYQIRRSPPITGRFLIEVPESDWHPDLGLALSIEPPHENIDGDHINEVVKLTRTAPNRTPEIFESMLASEIRNAASSNTTIGSDCMCIRICPLRSPMVNIRFIPDPDAEPRRSGRKIRIEECEGIIAQAVPKDAPTPTEPPTFDDIETSYTPWILLPKMVVPPCRLIGTQQLTSDWVSVILEGPKVEGIVGALISQVRPSSP